MRTIPTLTALAVAVAFATTAHAVTTYTFSVDGTLTFGFGAERASAPWSALLVIEAPDGDGVFDDFGITFNGGRLFPYGWALFDGFAVPLVVTVASGVMSLDGHAVDGPGQYGFQGMSMTYALPVAHTVGAAQLTLVPEPSTWAMLLAGLGVAGALQRRRA